MSKKNKEITTVKTFVLLLVNIFKFIIFPIRKPLIGIPLLFLLFIIPTFRGVKPAEVHLWYLAQLKPIGQVFVNFGDAVNRHSIEPIKDTVSKIVDTDGNFISDDTRLRTSTDLEPRKQQQIEDDSNRDNYSNRVFEKAQNSSTTYKVEDNIIADNNLLNKEISNLSKEQEKIVEDVKEIDQELEAEISEIDNQLAKEIEAIDNRLENQVEDVEDKLDKIIEKVQEIKESVQEEKRVELVNEPVIKAEKQEEVIIQAAPSKTSKADNTNVYIKENSNIRPILKPEFIEGKAQIENANVLVINRRRIYFHGIYTNPFSEKGKAAVTYLINLINKKIVRCDIIAYTSNDIPTGICYTGGKNINDELARVGLSQKVKFKK